MLFINDYFWYKICMIKKNMNIDCINFGNVLRKVELRSFYFENLYNFTNEKYLFLFLASFLVLIPTRFKRH